MSRIYVVDDDRDIVESITTVLESAGHEVACQYDDTDVVKRTAAFAPDLVLLDVIFPEDDSAGFKMARALRHNEATRSVPILMLSAINAKGDYAYSFSNRDRDNTYLPVDEFVEKPIQPADLIQKVKDLLAN